MGSKSVFAMPRNAVNLIIRYLNSKSNYESLLTTYDLALITVQNSYKQIIFHRNVLLGWARKNIKKTKAY